MVVLMLVVVVMSWLVVVLEPFGSHADPSKRDTGPPVHD